MQENHYQLRAYGANNMDTSDLKELIQQLIETFTVYIDSTIGIPEAAPFSIDTGITLTAPQSQSTGYLNDKNIEPVDSERDPDPSEGEYYYDDIHLFIGYNVLTDTWSIYYNSVSTYGFVIVCEDLHEGLKQGIKCLEQQLAFIMGDVETYAENVDNELQMLLEAKDE